MRFRNYQGKLKFNLVWCQEQIWFVSEKTQVKLNVLESKFLRSKRKVSPCLCALGKQHLCLTKREFQLRKCLTHGCTERLCEN